MSNDDTLGKSRKYWEGVQTSDEELYGDYAAEQIAQYHIWALSGFEKIKQFFPLVDRETFTNEAIAFWDHHKAVLQQRNPEAMNDPARESMDFSEISELFPWISSGYQDIDILGSDAEELFQWADSRRFAKPDVKSISAWANYLFKGVVEGAEAARALPNVPRYAMKSIGVADKQASMTPEIILQNMPALAACLLKIAARELEENRPENSIGAIGLASDPLRLAEKARSKLLMKMNKAKAR